jgi:hypothetical protein
MNETTRNWDALISTISLLARTPGKATSIGPLFDIAFDPISVESFEEEERRLSIRLPHFLKRLYTEVGNGGFGPGVGLLSMVSLSSSDHPISYFHTTFREALSLRRAEWAKSVVAFSHWGCLILSCVDLDSPDENDPSVLRFEPNMPQADTLLFLKGRPFRGTGLIPECDNLSTWFENWINGMEMFERPYEIGF